MGASARIHVTHFSIHSTNYDEVTTLCQGLLSALSILVVKMAESVSALKDLESIEKDGKVQSCLLQKKGQVLWTSLPGGSNLVCGLGKASWKKRNEGRM